MATKNLARSSIEAGNLDEYREARRGSRRRHRHEAKAYCHRVTRDQEWLEGAPEPVSPQHRRPDGCWASDVHGDKLGGVLRLLETFVGRHWDDVYAEIRRRFDTRTLAGWHVLEQHVRSQYAREGSFRAEYARYVIGTDGIVRKPPEHWRPRSVRTSGSKPTVTGAEVATWLAGRKIAVRGAERFWLIPTASSRVYTEQEPRFDYLRQVQVADTYSVRACSWRQGRRLTREERAFFDRLTPAQQHVATDRSPERTLLASGIPIPADVA